MGIRFSSGERGLNRLSGKVGKVIGYGHEIVNGGYTPTVKVLIARVKNSGRTAAVEEDLYLNWTQSLNC